MNDLISRQMAIYALSMMQGIVAEEGVRKGISMAWQQIKDLPSAQPEPKWIPCSERLPEEKKDVLAVDDEGFFYIAQYEVYGGKRYWIETTEYLSIDAVAWQPLPEPYNGEG